MTSYSNAGGQGNRTSLITVTASPGLFARTYFGGSTIGTPFVDSDLAVIVNGVSLDTLGLTSGITDGWLKFDFGGGHRKVIDAFVFWLFGGTSQGTWRWFGSDDDSTYYGLGSAFILHGVSPPGPTGAAFEFFEPSGNTEGFRYYKLVQQSGATQPYKLREMEFRIAEGIGESESQSEFPSEPPSEPGTALIAVLGGNTAGPPEAARAMDSTDGITWTGGTTPINGNGTGILWEDIAYAPALGIFCAVANNAQDAAHRVATSTDGLSWTLRTATAAISWQAICWSPTLSLFVALAATGTGNRIMTSPDGITWTGRSSTGLDFEWSALAWSPTLGLFAAVSSGFGSNRRVMTSPDGINWTLQTGAPTSGLWTDIVWNPDAAKFMAVRSDTDSPRTMESADGLTWTTHNAIGLIGYSYVSICYSHTLAKYLMTADNSSDSPVATSTDGITWSQTLIASGSGRLRQTVWSEVLQLFITVSYKGTGNRIFTSPNGSTWTPRTSPVSTGAAQWWTIALAETPGGPPSEPSSEPSDLVSESESESESTDPEYDNGDRRGQIWVSHNCLLAAGDSPITDRLIDGSIVSTVAGAFKFNHAQSGASLMFDFGPTGFKQRIVEFRFLQSTSATHGRWNFEASPDAVNYTVLKNNFTLGAGTSTTYPFANLNGYRFYRLRQVSGATDGTPWIQEIQFKRVKKDRVLTSMPFYRTGDRRARITVTATAAFDGDMQKLVDGNASANVLRFNGGESGKTITFDFGVKNGVNEARWKQSDSTSHGTWKWRGSNDLDTWKDLGAPFDMRGVLTFGTNYPTWVQANFSGSIRGFRYYQLFQVGGLTSGVPYLYEIEFREGEWSDVPDETSESESSEPSEPPSSEPSEESSDGLSEGDFPIPAFVQCVVIDDGEWP